jgi:hypothetical protein
VATLRTQYRSPVIAVESELFLDLLGLLLLHWQSQAIFGSHEIGLEIRFHTKDLLMRCLQLSRSRLWSCQNLSRSSELHQQSS